MSFETIMSMNLCDDTIRSYFKDVFLINQNMAHKMLAGKYGKKVQADEDLFPYKNQCLELIISCLTLHWINDIPGSLIQIRRSLKPNGLFMGAVFRSEEHTSELQSRSDLVCRLLLEKKKNHIKKK